MLALYGLVTICLFGIALAEELPGACPDIKTMPDFELSKFSRRWFEAMRYAQKSESHAKCVSALYIPRNDGALKFIHSQIDTSIGRPLSMEGALSQPNPNEPGKLEMSFRGMPFKGNFWILGTDYNTYAVVYSCKNSELSHVTSAWILTRDQHPANTVIDDAIQVAVKHDLDLKPFENTDQTHCIV